MRPIQAGGWTGPEKRQHKRVPLGVPLECESDREVIRSKAENISVKGLLVRAEKTFAEDEEIALRFSLPGSGQRMQCRARVAHVVPDIFMGVEFSDLSPEAALLIEEFIAAGLGQSGKRS